MTFWLNGDFCEDARAIAIADRGFLLGDGVFETFRVDRGVASFFQRHLSRLGTGLAALQIEAAIPPDLNAVIFALAERNALSDRVASARLTVSRGASGRGLAFSPADAAAPTMLLTIAPAPAPAPARLIISRRVRAEGSVAARHKTLNYLDNILALNEARAAGADDAVMLNGRGRVACASGANLFLVSGGVVATPPVGEGALPGVVRAELLAGAGAAGAVVVERALEVEALREGAVFLTNSLVGLNPARLAEGRAPGAAETEIFKALAAWYHRRLLEDHDRQSGAL